MHLNRSCGYIGGDLLKGLFKTTSQHTLNPSKFNPYQIYRKLGITYVEIVIESDSGKKDLADVIYNGIHKFATHKKTIK